MLVPPAEVMRALAGASPALVVLALALYLSSHLVGSLNFHRLLRARGASVSRLDVIAADLAGHFFALSLPIGAAAGGAIRLVRLARSVPVAVVVAAIASSRLLEILAYAVSASLALPFVVAVLGRPLPWSTVVAAMLAVATLGYAASWHPRMLGVMRSALRRISVTRTLRARLDGLLEPLLSAPAASPAAQAAILAQALIRHLLGGLAVLAIAYALGLEIGFAAVLWVRAMTSLLLLLPVTIAGLGLREGGFVVLLAPFGVPAADAFSVALLVFAGQLTLAGIGGLVEAVATLRGGSQARAGQRA